ncbi:hypothetical protein I4U23_030381 [Adineta vaga]|nr:hypothetical protein I4U23_030381 [Adineta vaga]
MYPDLNSLSQIPEINHQNREVNYFMDLLEQWVQNNCEGDPIDYDEDLYFDCFEPYPDKYDLMKSSTYDDRFNHQHTVMNLHDGSDSESLFYESTMYHPWISEIWLTLHRKTSLFRRFLNYFHRSRRPSLPILAEEFVRIYGGHFSYPIGYRFYLSYAKEKWLLVLHNVKYDNSVFPYPSTRITFVRKGVLYTVR